MKLSKNSFHYRFNVYMEHGYIEDKYTRDFCSYFWLTMTNCAYVIFILIMSLLAVTAMAVNWETSLMVLGIVLTVAIIISGILAFGEYISNKPKGFIRASYDKFKEDTCHKIDWTN